MATSAHSRRTHHAHGAAARRVASDFMENRLFCEMARRTVGVNAKWMRMDV